MVVHDAGDVPVQVIDGGNDVVTLGRETSSEEKQEALHNHPHYRALIEIGI